VLANHLELVNCYIDGAIAFRFDIDIDRFATQLANEPEAPESFVQSVANIGNQKLFILQEAAFCEE
jgi:hypothetical protein